VGEQENQLDKEQTAGVDDPVPAQNGGDQGDDQIAGVGVNDRGLFYRVQMHRLTQHGAEENQNYLNDGCGKECQQQALYDLIGIVHLKGGENHAGHDQVQ